VPVATIVEGKAMSCGAILFSCGAEGYRFMGANSTLMIHDVSSGSFGKVEEIKSDAKEVDRLNDKIYKMMATNVGKPEDYFLNLVHERGHSDWYLSPEDCKSHNLTNHIRLPSFHTSIEVKTIFA
jgi:ATP-dependent Clp protease protease subunit